jgi:hypothetical protein
LDVSLIVLLGLPVLYLTGNLRKAISSAGIRGNIFVMYFVIAILLSLIPVIRIFPWISISFSGAFLCIAPAVYIALQGGFTYRFFLAASLTVLLSITAFFVTNTLTLPYLTPVLGLAVSAVAVICHGRRAAEYAPVLAGLFGAADSVMALLADIVRTVVLFNVSALAALCFTVCLFTAFLSFRPRRRHAVKASSDATTEAPHNKI